MVMMARLTSVTAVIAVIVVALTTVVSTVGATASPVIQTKYGPVVGTVETANGVDVNVFHSIPFAAPPVGDLRFRRPQPPQPWTETKDVSGLSTSCPQLNILDLFFIGGEDCLYVNVYAPVTADNQKLPVMFWIFGGGYVMGSGYEFGFYDGVNMASKFNVIVVAPNYRVGSFGFLSLPELKAEDPEGSTGNMALLDQTLALHWVQDNIENFGGDKSKVSIFGESAGGFSICWHLVSPTSAGLFSAAIMESGTCDSKSFYYGTEMAYAYGRNVTVDYGCPASGPETLSCLRKLSVKQIMDAKTSLAIRDAHKTLASTLSDLHVPKERLAHVAAPALAPVMPWGPVIDGVSLLEFPQTSLLSGNFNKVPTIFGTNLNEGRIFVPAMPLVVPGTHFPPTASDTEKSMYHFFSYYSNNETEVARAAESVLTEYPSSSYSNEWFRASAILTNWFFTCPTRRSAKAIASHGVPIYLYQFTYNLSPWIEYGLLGDYHTSEIDFVFGNQWPIVLHWFYKKSDFEISAAMGQYWTNMAAVGSPNGKGTQLNWPRFNATDLLSINLAWPLSVKQDMEGSVCDYWDNLLDGLDGGG